MSHSFFVLHIFTVYTYIIQIYIFNLGVLVNFHKCIIILPSKDGKSYIIQEGHSFGAHLNETPIRKLPLKYCKDWIPLLFIKTYTYTFVFQYFTTCARSLTIWKWNLWTAKWAMGFVDHGLKRLPAIPEIKQDIEKFIISSLY